ncbi:TPA_asm: RNA-directed RNA polymerase [ssRNA phage SRR7976357_3]|uniref:RNA-directed RNA polymerase n=1 Tax=ssRNA phage SRR7976357_3 TaxID=2786743 RepID=A0A8S5L0U6_9VIRU|nr:RNA-directed RNA polymerase [ssRNA phage SRR7976357_3]DAD51257.1 TPA_asm: RNA-directed RNA polymerase [ssRNA phage SRR7976357_3]
MSTKDKWLVRLFSTIQADLQTVARGTPRGEACHRFVTRMKKRARLGNDKTLATEAKKAFAGTNEKVAVKIELTHEEILYASDYLRHLLWSRTTSVRSVPQSSITDDDIFEYWRFGPGASFETTGTHAAEKLLADQWTCTSAAEPYVIRLLMAHPYLNAYHGGKSRCTKVVRGSKLGTVPKNDETDRTICTEPLGNMALQLAVGHVLEDVLLRAGFGIDTQSRKNEVLAWVGSISNELATLDLSRASDMISPFLVRALWPEDIFDLFVTIRSPEILMDNGWTQANMISTMGNGFTFPMMTLTLLSLVYANRAINHGGHTNNWLDPEITGVFGDDIIVPSQEFETLCDILARAGLVVNHDKSFSDGPFRESCGGDYWNGENITPPYIKSCSSPSDIYVTINKVVQWCVLHNVYMPRTMCLFQEMLVEMSLVHVVPEWLGPEQGLQSRDCPRQYVYLRVKPYMKTLRNEHFLMTLACGGYVTPFIRKKRGCKASVEDKGIQVIQYTPRVNVAKFESRKGRLPSGYLHGWDPLLLGDSASLAVADLISQLLP